MPLALDRRICIQPIIPRTDFVRRVKENIILKILLAADIGGISVEDIIFSINVPSASVQTPI